MSFNPVDYALCLWVECWVLPYLLPEFFHHLNQFIHWYLHLIHRVHHNLYLIYSSERAILSLQKHSPSDDIYPKPSPILLQSEQHFNCVRSPSELHTVLSASIPHPVRNAGMTMSAMSTRCTCLVAICITLPVSIILLSLVSYLLLRCHYEVITHLHHPRVCPTTGHPLIRHTYLLEYWLRCPCAF